MAKALYGTIATPSHLQLLDEIRSLRERVAQLEAALEDAQDAAAERSDLQLVVDEAPAGVGA
jgi:hypothetical protein